MNKKLYLIICFSFFFASGSFAQTVFDIHFNGFAFLDDHEYNALIPLRKTISGTRTAIDFSLSPDSLNHFVFGVNALHEFGAVPFYLTVNPVAYYKFDNGHWFFSGGEFPRQGLLTQYPRALMNDTLLYYRPNVEGMLLRNTNRFGYESLWIDWVSRQTAVNRNQFLAGFLGKFQPDTKGPFYVSHYFMFMHDAGTKPLQPNSPIEDNGGGQLRLGLDLTHKQTFFDSLSFEVGGMVSAHRVRSENQFAWSRGFVASFYASYKFVALYDEFYQGKPNYIMYGDPFYIKPVYNRLDVKLNAFKAKRLRGSFMFSFHSSPGHPGDLSEVFQLMYDLGRVRLATIKSL
jgi:hypothetical protein